MTLRQEILNSLADDAESIVQIWNHVETFYPDVRFGQFIGILRKMAEEGLVTVLTEDGNELPSFPEAGVEQYWFDLSAKGREMHNSIPDVQPQWDDIFISTQSARFSDVQVRDDGFSVKIQYSGEEVIKKIKIVQIDDWIDIYGYKVQAEESCGRIDTFSYKTDMRRINKITQCGQRCEERILWSRE